MSNEQQEAFDNLVPAAKDHAAARKDAAIDVVGFLIELIRAERCELRLVLAVDGPVWAEDIDG